MFNNKRRDSRDECIIPVEFIGSTKDTYVGTARNISPGGICFQSEQCLEFGEPVYIRKLNGTTPEAFSAYTALVKWRSKSFNRHLYLIGAQYTVKGVLTPIPAERSPLVPCEMCGKTHLDEIYRTDDHLMLCSYCFREVGGLASDTFRDGICRFLQGNVI